MDDVARQAGVSRQTVSRVINDSGPVAVATRTRVLAAMRALRYTPDPAAQRMGRNRSDRHDLSAASLPPECIDALDVLRAAGLTVEVRAGGAVLVRAPASADRGVAGGAGPTAVPTDRRTADRDVCPTDPRGPRAPHR